MFCAQFATSGGLKTAAMVAHHNRHWRPPRQVGKHIGFVTVCAILRLKMIDLPRQARDKQREKALKQSDLFSYAGARVFPARSRALAVSCQSCRRLYGKVKTNAFFGASLMHTHDEFYQDRLETNI